MRPSKPEKTMSSRLLTMKFMQRAAAAGVHTPSTPTSTRPSDEDSSASVPPAKRRRSDQNIPTSVSSDLDAISAAVKAEEDKRQAALARQAADAGETNWVLEFPGAGTREAEERDEGPVVVSMVSEDADGAWGQGQEEEEEFDGRRGYGGYKRKKKSTEPRASLGTSSQNIDEDALPTSISGGQPSRAHDHRRGDDQSDLNNMVRDHKYKSERDEARRRKLAAQGYKKRAGGGGKLKGGISSGGISSGGGISKPSQGQQGSKGKRRR